VVLTVACLGWAACGVSSAVKVDASGLPTNRPVTRGELQHFPESRLFFPGSTVVLQIGANQTPTSPGEEPDAAYTGAIFAAHASSTALFAWYATTLNGRGFTPAISHRLSTQTSGQAWQRHGRLQVQVGVFDPAALQSATGIRVAVPLGTIVYESILVGYRPGLPKA
jgi:hypothetical protein